MKPLTMSTPANDKLLENVCIEHLEPLIVTSSLHSPQLKPKIIN